MKTLVVSLSELTLHPALQQQPGEWPEDDPRFEALCRDIQEQGVLHPLLITADRRIVDGRHRWRAARRLGLATVPCAEINGHEAIHVILSTLLARRHYTAGQRAYLVADLIEDAWRLAAEKRKMNAAKNETTAGRFEQHQALTQDFAIKIHLADSIPMTGLAAYAAEEFVRSVGDYARALGVSVRYLQMARTIWELFRACPEKFTWSPEVLKPRGLPPGTELTLREYFEPLILDDHEPVGLSRVIEGLSQKIWQRDREAKGIRHPGRADVIKDCAKQIRLLWTGWETLSVRARDYWEKLPPEAKREVCDHVEEVMRQTPRDFLSQVHAMAAQELKRRKKEGDDHA
jgi:hypothetical protein